MNDHFKLGRVAPDDPAAAGLPDSEAVADAERESLSRKWETYGLTADEKARLDELTAARAGGRS